MKLEELFEAGGHLRYFSDREARDEMAEIADDLAADETIPKKIKPSEFSTQQVKSFLDAMEKFDAKHPEADEKGEPNDSDEDIQRYQDFRYDLMRKILKVK